MPVMSAYSTSGSSYISPTSYRYKSSICDRRSYIPSNSFRRNSYRYDLPSTTYPSYRADHTTDAELSASLSLASVSSSTAKECSTSESCSTQPTSPATPVVNSKDSTSFSRPSRSTAYSYSTLSAAPTRDYTSRFSSRSSDNRYRDRDNNYLCTGGASSSSYVSNIRSTALSGAEIYQKYSVSTYKPNSFERSISRSQPESVKPSSILSSTSSFKASSPLTGTLDVSKATIKLPPSLNGTATGSSGPRIFTTTDDLDNGECHVTATIRIKPKSSISHSTSSSSSNSTSGSTTSINNNNGATTNSDGTDERDLPSSGTGKSADVIVNSSNNNSNSSSSNYNNNGDVKDGNANGEDEDEDAPAVGSAAKLLDKESKSNDDDRVAYLRAGATSKSILSTSPTNYREYDSGSYRSGLGTSSSAAVQKSSYDRTLDNSIDSPRSGGSRKEGLCGLWNIGNTCFMNSIIQCLSHTRELTSFLRSQPSAERGTSKDHKILAEYTKLIKDMWNGTNRSVNPSELKHAFSSKHRMYSGSAQQDAQEFLRFFIDSLHSALNVSIKREPISKEIEDDDLNNRIKATMMWEWYSKVENSMIKDLFVGLLRSTLKCTVCNNASVTFDPFWDLSLPLPSTNSRCKLESCLDVFVKEEVMDGIDQPTCSKCKTRRKCTKSFAIERFPKYLVIHLKRFSETRWSKLTNVIEFPTGERELNLQPYASEDNVGPVNYSLYGISNHMGSTAGGHYVAVCKHPISKEWNEFNDNFVSETSERSLVTSSAYVLFYERA